MWDTIKKKLGFDQPSVIGNLLKKNPWNLNLPQYGGIISPMQTFQKLGQTPFKDFKLPKEIKSPVPNPGQSPIIRTLHNIGTPIPKAYAQAIPTPTPDPRVSWKNFADMVIREGNAKGYSGETLARQKALESGFGKSQFARERYNYGGVGAYDRNPDQALSFKSPEDYLNYYFNLVQKRYPSAYKVRSNPRQYITELKKGGYASDPNYVWKVLNTPIYNGD